MADPNIVWDDEIAWDDEAAAAPAPINSLPGATASVGPTNRRIRSKGPLGVGQTIRAVGSYLPGTDYGASAGYWLEDRLPEAIGGQPAGQERTWRETLDDARADRERAADAEPLAAVAGAVLGTKNLPWAKGSGVLKALTRAGQAAGLTGVTKLTQGEDLGSAAAESVKAGGASALLEGALHLPGALRSVGSKLRGAASDRAWRAGAFTPAQAEAAADALDPEGVSAKVIVGNFMRDAKLSNGTPVVGMDDDAAAVFGKLQRYIEEQGAAKGALVARAEGQGAVVDSGAVMGQVRGLISELDTPEMRVAYPDIQSKLRAFADRMEAEYGPKAPQLVGVSLKGTGARPSQAGPPGASVGPDIPTAPRAEVQPRAGLTLPPEGPPPMVSYGTPGYRAVPGEAPQRAYVYKQDMEHVPAGDRLYPGTTRPAPDSGWSPVFAEPPPPRTFAEWEKLKTMLQSLVEDTKSGLNRSEAAIEASPALKKLRAFGSTIREADEVAARKVLSPEDFQAFMSAKKNFGTASEVSKPFKMAVHGEEAASPMSLSYELRRAGRMLPWTLAGGMGGYATGNPVNVLSGAAAGALAGKGAQVFEHANPTMTRVYDAVGRKLSGAKGPDINLPDELAALLAYLRQAKGENR